MYVSVFTCITIIIVHVFTCMYTMSYLLRRPVHTQSCHRKTCPELQPLNRAQVMVGATARAGRCVYAPGKPHVSQCVLIA